VFDLSKSPLTLTLPDTGKRYMSAMVVSQDHDIYPARYAPGKWTFTQEEIGTRYIMIGLRTFADPNSEQDLAQAHKLQDAVKVEQKDKGDLSGLPEWDTSQMLEVRKHFDALDPAGQLHLLRCQVRPLLPGQRHGRGRGVGRFAAQGCHLPGAPGIEQ